jgi:hypothetical protein
MNPLEPVTPASPESTKNTIKALAFIFLLALLPAVLFSIKGYGGDDFYFHVPSWMELRDGWLAGQLWPGWASKANYTLGDPRFCFYPPFSFVLGGGLGLLLPLRFVPCAYMALISFVSGISMYVAGKRFIPQGERLPAAFLYMLSPYLVTSQLIHFSAAELLVQAWLPLILVWFFETQWGSNGRILLLGCLLGLSWLTDVPASIVLFYGLLLVSIVAAWEHQRLEPVLRFVATEGIAGMLAAFYLMPVLMEQKWINTGGLLLRFVPRQFVIFLPGQWVAEGKVPSWVLEEWANACFTILLIAICIVSRHRLRKEGPHIRFWVYLALITLFFHLPLSLPLWNFLPEMHAVQFPFRFIPYVGVALPMVLFAKGTPMALRKPIYIVMLLLTLIPIQRYLRGTPITSAGKDSFARLEGEWERNGYFSPPEYGPVTGKGLGLRPVDNRPDGPPAEQLCGIPPMPLPTRGVQFSTSSSEPCTVVLNVYFYPYWHALTESGTVLTTAVNQKGLLSVEVPAGKHTVQVFFKPASTARTVSSAASLLTLAFVILCLIYTVGWRFRLHRSSGESRDAPLAPHSERA